MASIESARAQIREYAIIVNASDNVAVVKKTTAPGLEILLPDGAVVELHDAVPPGPAGPVAVPAVPL